MLKTKEEIKNWLDEMGVKNYTINEDLTVDASEVCLGNKGLTEIPVQFGKVMYDFCCRYNKLKSLRGSPKRITDGSFRCDNNDLDSLEGSPEHVGNNMYCYNNPLKKGLIGHPKTMCGGIFYCYSSVRYATPPYAIKGINPYKGDADRETRCCYT